MPYKTLLVSRLPPYVNDDILQCIFFYYHFFPITANVMMDVGTSRSKGFGFVSFATELEGLVAFSYFQNNQGKRIWLPEVLGERAMRAAIAANINPYYWEEDYDDAYSHDITTEDEKQEKHQKFLAKVEKEVNEYFARRRLRAQIQRKLRRSNPPSLNTSSNTKHAGADGGQGTDTEFPELPEYPPYFPVGYGRHSALSLSITVIPSVQDSTNTSAATSSIYIRNIPLIADDMKTIVSTDDDKGIHSAFDKNRIVVKDASAWSPDVLKEYLSRFGKIVEFTTTRYNQNPSNISSSNLSTTTSNSRSRSATGSHSSYLICVHYDCVVCAVNARRGIHWMCPGNVQWSGGSGNKASTEPEIMSEPLGPLGHFGMSLRTINKVYEQEAERLLALCPSSRHYAGITSTPESSPSRASHHTTNSGNVTFAIDDTLVAKEVPNPKTDHDHNDNITQISDLLYYNCLFVQAIGTTAINAPLNALAPEFVRDDKSTKTTAGDPHNPDINGSSHEKRETELKESANLNISSQDLDGKKASTKIMYSARNPALAFALRYHPVLKRTTTTMTMSTTPGVPHFPNSSPQPLLLLAKYSDNNDTRAARRERRILQNSESLKSKIIVNDANRIYQLNHTTQVGPECEHGPGEKNDREEEEGEASSESEMASFKIDLFHRMKYYNGLASVTIGSRNLCARHFNMLLSSFPAYSSLAAHETNEADPSRKAGEDSNIKSSRPLPVLSISLSENFLKRKFIKVGVEQLGQNDKYYDEGDGGMESISRAHITIGNPKNGPAARARELSRHDSNNHTAGPSRAPFPAMGQSSGPAIGECILGAPSPFYFAMKPLLSATEELHHESYYFTKFIEQEQFWKSQKASENNTDSRNSPNSYPDRGAPPRAHRVSPEVTGAECGKNVFAPPYPPVRASPIYMGTFPLHQGAHTQEAEATSPTVANPNINNISNSSTYNSKSLLGSSKHANLSTMSNNNGSNKFLGSSKQANLSTMSNNNGSNKFLGSSKHANSPSPFPVAAAALNEGPSRNAPNNASGNANSDASPTSQGIKKKPAIIRKSALTNRTSSHDQAPVFKPLLSTENLPTALEMNPLGRNNTSASSNINNKNSNNNSLLFESQEGSSVVSKGKNGNSLSVMHDMSNRSALFTVPLSTSASSAIPKKELNNFFQNFDNDDDFSNLNTSSNAKDNDAQEDERIIAPPKQVSSKNVSFNAGSQYQQQFFDPNATNNGTFFSLFQTSSLYNNAPGAPANTSSSKNANASSTSAGGVLRGSTGSCLNTNAAPWQAKPSPVLSSSRSIGTPVNSSVGGFINPVITGDMVPDTAMHTTVTSASGSIASRGSLLPLPSSLFPAPPSSSALKATPTTSAKITAT